MRDAQPSRRSGHRFRNSTKSIAVDSSFRIEGEVQKNKTRPSWSGGTGTIFDGYFCSVG